MTISCGMVYESTGFGFQQVSDQRIEKLIIHSFNQQLNIILENSQPLKTSCTMVNRIYMGQDEFFGSIVNLFPNIHHADFKSIDISEISERMMKMFLQQWPYLDTLEIPMLSNIYELCDCLVDYTKIKKLVVFTDHDDIDDCEEVLKALKAKHDKFKNLNTKKNIFKF